MSLAAVSSTAKGLRDLQKEVLDAGLCTMCGACVGHCPYLRRYEGRVVVLDNCDLGNGDCYRYCPRTPTDWDVLNQTAYGAPYTLDGLGTVRHVAMCRSTSSQIHQRGQDGGVVTALLTLALDEGLIDAAVAAITSDDWSPLGIVARSEREILRCAGNSYEASFSLEALNRLPEESQERLAVVGLPCQVEALAKMQAYHTKATARIRNVRLVLGLFCGWALMPRAFHEFLRKTVDPRQVIKFDIPHHPANSFDIYDRSGAISIELDRIRPFVNPGCSYCLDMTSEFADISVGSGRRMYGWNTVVIRSERGQELYEMAQSKGVIAETAYPEENLVHLKRASLNKKKLALERIIHKSGSKDDLIYLAGSATRRQEFLSLLEQGSGSG